MATRIPKEIIDALKLNDGQEFKVMQRDGVILLVPIYDIPKTFDELVKGWQTDSYRAGEMDWSQAVGKELEW